MKNRVAKDKENIMNVNNTNMNANNPAIIIGDPNIKDKNYTIIADDSNVNVYNSDRLSDPENLSAFFQNTINKITKPERLYQARNIVYNTARMHNLNGLNRLMSLSNEIKNRTDNLTKEKGGVINFIRLFFQLKLSEWVEARNACLLLKELSDYTATQISYLNDVGVNLDNADR